MVHLSNLLKESILNHQPNINNEVILEWINTYLKEPKDYAIIANQNKYYVKRTRGWKNYIQFYNHCPSITNGLFEWIWPKDIDLCIEDCDMVDLIGSPSSVDSLYISGCNKLISLKGAPRKIRTDFNLSNNRSLKDLQGLKNTDIYAIYINGSCKLESLLGLGKVKREIFISDCDKLKNLCISHYPTHVRIDKYSCPSLQLNPQEDSLVEYV